LENRNNERIRRPSRADIEMAQAIADVARRLGIAVHDHLIVGKAGHASLKALKLM
jgi:DNA repair protein RadC